MRVPAVHSPVAAPARGRAPLPNHLRYQDRGVLATWIGAAASAAGGVESVMVADLLAISGLAAARRICRPRYANAGLALAPSLRGLRSRCAETMAGQRAHPRAPAMGAQTGREGERARRYHAASRRRGRPGATYSPDPDEAPCGIIVGGVDQQRGGPRGKPRGRAVALARPWPPKRPPAESGIGAYQSGPSRVSQPIWTMTAAV